MFVAIARAINIVYLCDEAKTGPLNSCIQHSQLKDTKAPVVNIVLFLCDLILACAFLCEVITSLVIWLHLHLAEVNAISTNPFCDKC